jgi:hypothetical protein
LLWLGATSRGIPEEVAKKKIEVSRLRMAGALSCAAPRRASAALARLAALASLLVAVSDASAPTGYKMHSTRVVASRSVCANGRSRLLRLENPEDADSYRAGHVLGLELDDSKGVARRGPYTVARADASEGWLEIVYRVIDPMQVKIPPSLWRPF